MSPPLIGFLFFFPACFLPHAVFLSLSFILTRLPFPRSLSFCLSPCPLPLPPCSVAPHFLAWHCTLESSPTILSSSERDTQQPVPSLFLLSSPFYLCNSAAFSICVTVQFFRSSLSSLAHTPAHVYRLTVTPDSVCLSVCMCLTGQGRLSCRHGV